MEITMAMQITEETYPIAVACLPAGFLLVPPTQSYNLWLVINEIRMIEDDRWDASEKRIVVANSWYDKETFFDKFEPAGDMPPNTPFFPVYSKPQ